jgi:KTSC domain-containing protein
MNWVETPESSNIARFGYDKANQVLIVEFKHGGTYNYYEVQEFVFEQMKTASSKGQFISQNIKGRYRYARA